MIKIEKLFLVQAIGSIPPLVGFLGGWWITNQQSATAWVTIAALSGMVLGLIIDILFLKKWVARAFDMDMKIWMGIFFFYSICVFGFFMGVPIFNVILAIPAGLFIGRKLAHKSVSVDEEKRFILRTKLYTTCVMAFICVSSAFLALLDPSTAANLEGMLRLNFDVTQVMIIALIVVGGGSLLIMHWWMVKKIIQFARGVKVTSK
ncbi:MAG: hypothetical protein CVU42_08625 [Chloroflexi bacterium HGW-Chloroflexi-4]|jgi:hypothetical protein|nr:MAG: hypothetical protein CVU42_08625 [Chloroflexi bacterium HGW-Chloroflexi-4]